MLLVPSVIFLHSYFINYIIILYCYKHSLAIEFAIITNNVTLKTIIGPLHVHQGTI